MKAKIEKTLSARTRSRVVRTKRNTPKRSEERNERKIDRFRQKVDKKRRKDLRFFFQSPHDFFNAYTLRTPRQTKPAQKGGAYSEKWGNAPPFGTHTSKEEPIIVTKRKTKHLLIPNFCFTFAETHQKNTPHLAIFLPLRIHLSLSLPLRRALDRQSFAGFTFNLFISL